VKKATEPYTRKRLNMWIKLWIMWIIYIIRIMF